MMLVVVGSTIAVLGLVVYLSKNMTGVGNIAGNCGARCQEQMIAAAASARFWSHVGLAGLALVVVGVLVRLQKPKSF